MGSDRPAEILPFGQNDTGGHRERGSASCHAEGIRSISAPPSVTRTVTLREWFDKDSSLQNDASPGLPPSVGCLYKRGRCWGMGL